MEENHEKFLDHLNYSNEGVDRVAREFATKGWMVRRPEVTQAKSHKEWKKHRDHGDLFVQGQRIEVKRLSVNWTGVEDWPFGEKFLVCAKHSFDSARPRPYAYLILSQDMSHVAVVYACTSHKWGTEEKTDSRYSGEEAIQKFYLCPLNLVRFMVIEELGVPQGSGG